MGKRWSCRVNWASCVSCEFLTGSRSQLSSWEYLGKRRFYNYSICLLPKCFSHSLMWHITILFSFFFVLNFGIHTWLASWLRLRNAGYKERFSTADHITWPASLLDAWKPCGADVVGFLRGNKIRSLEKKNKRQIGKTLHNAWTVFFSESSGMLKNIVSCRDSLASVMRAFCTYEKAHFIWALTSFRQIPFEHSFDNVWWISRMVS